MVPLAELALAETNTGAPENEPSSDAESPAPGRPPTESPRHADTLASAGSVETIPGRRRPARYGLLVQYESRPDDLEMARLVDSTVWINEAHPAYQRALASRSVGYHTALAVALALASLAVEPSAEHAFITQFLAYWGGAASSSRRTTRRRGRPR